MTAEQFAADPAQADSVFLANDVRGTLDELRFGLTYRREEILGRDELEVTGYYVPRHLGPFVQIGVRIPQDFSNRGSTVRYVYAAPLAGHANRLTFGVDFQNTPITTGVFATGTGAALAALEENATTFGVYALEEFNLFDDLQFTLGARYDNIHFSSRNLAREGIPEASRTFTSATPKVGLTYQPVPALSLYATIAQVRDRAGLGSQSPAAHPGPVCISVRSST